ncbi:unnamed protein product [Sphagnum balticum]
MLQNSDEPPVADGAPLLENRPITAPTDSLLYVCTVLSIVSALGSVLCMVVNLVSLLRSFDSRGFDYRVSPFVLILRCYAVAIAFFVALAETEWEVIFRLWQVLEYWVGRGMFQIFIATLTKVLARASGETQAESVLHDVASWWLLICGIIYTAAGLLCIGRIKRSHMREVNRRQQAIKDLEEVHRRRAELEAQLGHS